jgi:hypothetical protein
MSFPDRLMIKSLPGKESVLYVRGEAIEEFLMERGVLKSEGIQTSTMYCQIGHFHWDIVLDGECPNHGPHRRGGCCGKEGPEDSDGTPILGCCSIPSP